MSLVRNLGRRKLRTTLTVLGIVIGIWALVVFSALATKIDTLVGSGTDYYVGKIVVSDGSSNGLGIGLIPIDVSLADQIRASTAWARSTHRCRCRSRTSSPPASASRSSSSAPWREPTRGLDKFRSTQPRVAS